VVFGVWVVLGWLLLVGGLDVGGWLGGFFFWGGVVCGLGGGGLFLCGGGADP